MSGCKLGPRKRLPRGAPGGFLRSKKRNLCNVSWPLPANHRLFHLSYGRVIMKSYFTTYGNYDLPPRSHIRRECACMCASMRDSLSTAMYIYTRTHVTQVYRFGRLRACTKCMHRHACSCETGEHMNPGRQPSGRVLRFSRDEL